VFRGFSPPSRLLGLIIGCTVAFALGDMTLTKRSRFGLRLHPTVPVRMPKFDFVACLT